jgi:HEAT repeat protein
VTDETAPGHASGPTPNPAADPERNPASGPAPPRSSFGGKWTWGVLALALLFVLMPFLFWNATWFGRPLTDDQISKSLADHKHAREIQHALTQIELRMEANDASVRRWYPQIAALASDPVTEIRVTDAWVMGQDTTSQEFHDALRKNLTDPQPMVQRNAALSLVRFGDNSGHAVILSMLQPFGMPSPFTGTIRERLKPGDALNPGTLVGHIDAPGGVSNEVRVAVPGTLAVWAKPDGSKIAEGETILLISPSQEMVWEALRALYLIGTPEDAAAIQPYVRGADGISPQVQKQAALTLQHLSTRARS